MSISFSSRSKRYLLLAGLLAGLILAGCSPEYSRARGGGQGADVGNRFLGPAMEIHGPVDPAFGEPIRSKAIEQSR